MQSIVDMPDSPEEQPDLWFSFIRAHRLMLREIERRLKAQGLPVYAWYDVLWGIESGIDGTRRMHELADALAIERYNLTRIVDRLVEDGLVKRYRSPEDRRAAYATITEKGRALRKRMWSIYEQTVAELFTSQFNTDEQLRFSQRLDTASRAARKAGL